MGLSNAERQRRHRERLKGRTAAVPCALPPPEGQAIQGPALERRGAGAADLQAEYQAWLDSLPENLRSSAVAEQLEAICDLDLDSLQEVEPPRGFGRD